MNRESIRGVAFLTIITTIAGGSLIWLHPFSRRLPPLPPLLPIAPLNHKELLDKELITAVYDGDLSHVSTLLRMGADPNARGYWDRSGLWDPDRHERVWDPANNTDGPTALMLAAFEGRKTILVDLITHGANVNGRDSVKNTALVYATLYGNIELAHILLDHGARVDTKAGGDDPLHFAAEFSDASLVRLLVSRGSQINVRYADGTIPLITAAQSASASVVQELLKDGADANVQGLGGQTALVAVVSTNTDNNSYNDIKVARANRTNQLATITVLIAYHANPNIRDSEGNTALHYAKTMARTDICNLLSKVGAKE